MWRIKRGVKLFQQINGLKVTVKTSERKQFSGTPCISRIFQGSFKGVSRKIEGCSERTSRVIQGRFKGIKKKFKGFFKGISWQFQ